MIPVVSFFCSYLSHILHSVERDCNRMSSVCALAPITPFWGVAVSYLPHPHTPPSTPHPQLTPIPNQKIHKTSIDQYHTHSSHAPTNGIHFFPFFYKNYEDTPQLRMKSRNPEKVLESQGHHLSKTSRAQRVDRAVLWDVRV